MTDITLTPCQETALQNFRLFINDPSKKEFVLSGAAGFGKSFLVQYLMEEVDKANEAAELLETPKVIKHYGFLAPTHKAAKVLSNFTGTPVATIHSAFSLMRKIDRDSGEVSFVKNPRKDVNISKDTLLFVEESSMISDYLLKTMMDHMPTGCRIVWLGDNLQLPPVNETHSPAFHRDADLAQLDTPVRFDNPELEALTMECRQAVKENRLPQIKESASIEVVGKDDFISKLLEANKRGDDCKVIAWTNRQVGSYAKMIHTELYGNKKFNIGQKMVVNKRFVSSINNAVFDTQTELELTAEAELSSLDINGTLVETNILHTDKGSFEMPIVKLHVTKAVKSLKEQKEWQQYYRIMDTIGDVSNNYAITVHQSQGSTYHTAFVDIHNIMRNNNFNEMLRLLYVSMSRASHRLVLYGK